MHITKKKDYYYLKHSFRKDGKTITKEKYLGKSIPSNIKRIQEQFYRELMNEKLEKKLETIKKNHQKEWSHYHEHSRNRFLLDLCIYFTYNTNAIEGSRISLIETDGIIKDGIAPIRKVTDIEETIKHSKLLLEVLRNEETINERTIKIWHEKLFRGTKERIAGKYREVLVRVGTYRAPDWQDVPKLMKELIKWYLKNKKTLHPIELAARFHHKFESIHPFEDGNGRVGRLIMASMLWHSKFPVLIIEYKRRTSYYNALENENKFYQYFIKRYMKEHEGLLKK